MGIPALYARIMITVLFKDHVLNLIVDIISALNIERNFKGEVRIMKNFEAPMMNIQRLDAGDVIVTSIKCSVEALHCESCYCTAVICDQFTCDANYVENPGCPSHW